MSLLFQTDYYIRKVKCWFTSLGKGECKRCKKTKKLYRGRPGRYWCKKCFIDVMSKNETI